MAGFSRPAPSPDKCGSSKTFCSRFAAMKKTLRKIARNIMNAIRSFLTPGKSLFS